MKSKYSLVSLLTLLMIVGLACQSSGPIGNLFASPTPTASITPTPTVTPSPTSTPTQTPSPTPTPIPDGTQIEILPDGQTHFIDYDNKYQYNLPASWVVLPITQEDISKSLEDAAKVDPEFAEISESFKNLDPDIFRLIGVHPDNEDTKQDTFPFMVSMAIDDAVAGTMPMSFVTAMIEDNLMTGATSVEWDVLNNKNGIDVGIVTGINSTNVAGQGKVKFFVEIISFQANKKLVVLQFMIPQGMEKNIIPELETMVDTIKFYKP